MRRSARTAIHAPSLLLFLTILVIPTIAQIPTGGVRGAVKDQTDAVVSGARITMINKDTGAERHFTTRADGEYQIVNLTPGEYEVKVTAGGFKTALSPVTVQVGENISLDFKLEVGAANETVVITSETAPINTTDFKIDGVVNRKQIENLPLNGRSFLQLAMLEPGVTVEAVDNPGTQPNNFFRVSIAGASSALTRISVDGATVNDRVTGGSSQNFSQETVQEFQISSFNFDLATTVTGVGSVNVVSRSGSNDFHGSGFIYYRDNNMSGFPALQRNPRRFIDPSLNEPFFARRQIGGAIGGPIKKDKAFFFFNYENNNQDGVVPIANRHPIFSQFDVAYPQPLNFHSTNAKFDYRINDEHNVFLRVSTDNNKNFNSANGVFMPSNWVATKNVAAQGLIGLTSVFTSKMVNDLRVSYGVYSGRLSIPDSGVCPDPVYCLGINSPRISTTLSNFIIGNNLNTPQNRVLRTYQLTDTFSWRKGDHGIRFGGEWEHHYGQGHWAFLEPAFVTLWDPLHIVAFIQGTGGFPNSPFVPLYNALPDSLKLNATGTGPLRPGLLPTYQDILRLPLAGFAAGVGDPGQPQPFNFNQAARNNRFKLFFADQWRAHPRFTLTYGVSYTYEDKLLNHDLDRPALLAPLLGGDLSPAKRDKNNFGPSLGFAWDLNGNGKTVLRGGGGIYYDSNLFWTRLNERAYIGPSGNGRYIVPGTIFTSKEFPNGLQFASFPTAYNGTRLAQELPFLRAAANALLGNGKDLSRRGVETLKTTGEIGFGTVFDPNTVVPYSMNASFGVQRELMQNMTLTADFVMRRSIKFGGLHSVFFIDRNRYNRARITQVDPVTGRGDSRPNPIIPLCVGAQALDPKAQCSNGSIGVSHAGANYRYTGLHVKLDRRFSNRYLFVASYALSKYTGFNGVINFDNFYEADDYQGADRTHKFTFSGFVDLPAYGGENRFVRGLLNTWKVGLISQFHSKPALQTTISSVDLDGDGNSTLILPGATFRGFGRGLDKDGVRALVAQYNKTLPTSVTGKRTVRDQVIPVITLPTDFSNGDTFISQDLRLTRAFRFREQVQLEFIGEVFNLFNISNLVGYGGTLNATDADGRPSFGLPSGRAGGVFGTGGPRAFQVAARLSF
ncbi:MAG: carboxypeptidase regulatory-like domain-containing protein [Blastocatellales bacterium]